MGEREWFPCCVHCPAYCAPEFDGHLMPCCDEPPRTTTKARS